MLVTLLGIVITSEVPLYSNKILLIIIKLLVLLSSHGVPANALQPTLVTLLGIVTEVKDVQLLNA